ncbi:MAG: hypothetical protein R6V46_01430, partial [Desulfatiglandaceae bacterium]
MKYSAYTPTKVLQLFLSIMFSFIYRNGDRGKTGCAVYVLFHTLLILSVFEVGCSRVVKAESNRGTLP